MRPIVMAVALLSVTALTSQASSPEEIARSYFELLQQKQWVEVAKLHSPASLAEFREMMSFLVDLPDEEAGEALTMFFGPSATKESVRGMSDIDFFSSFLGFVMAQIETVGAMEFRKLEVLGSVAEGDSLQHVLVRTHIDVGEISTEAMEVISMQRQGEGWGVLMQGKMKGVAEQMKRAMQQSEE